MAAKHFSNVEPHDAFQWRQYPRFIDQVSKVDPAPTCPSVSTASHFFADPLPTADVLILGRVLHDWSVPQRELLIRKAHAALPARGALIVYEAFIDDSRRKPGGLLSSLNMLLQTNDGSEFTTRQCGAWMQEAGFAGTRVIPLTDADAAVVGTKGQPQSVASS